MIFSIVCIAFLTSFFAIWQYRLRKKFDRDLEEARTKLSIRENRMQTILDNAPIVFSAIDKNGIFYISEGKGLQKLGRKDNESVGLSIFEMHKGNPVILEAVRKALNGEQITTSFVLRGVSYDLFIGPKKNLAGEVIGATMVSVDITDRKKVEEEKAQLQVDARAAMEASKMKSQFLATMSHEIRTPINGVLGMTSLLLDTPLSPQQREFAETIKNSGTVLLTVINDILDFSKIEAGRLDFEEMDFNLPELITHAMKSLTFAAQRKGLNITTELDPSLPAWVKSDPGRFRQVINNLVGNAIKFTEKGSVTIRIQSEPNPASGVGVRVEIEDTGIGIPKKSLDKMFEAFSQAEASMARRFGGTGLGLSICKQLVEKMGGSIGVESEEGRGSKFWFSVPFAVGKVPAEADPRIKNAPSAFFGEYAPKILVAEDNHVNQIITIAMLKKMGYNAEIAVNGLEALAALKKSAYNLILMDCQMPQMDGLEATRKIRAQPPSLNPNIPIVAMTANAMKGDREACLEAGMNDYVSKPISFEELKSTVQRWLEIARKRAS